MKRSLAVLCAAAALVAAGCGGGSGGSTPAVPSPVSTPVRQQNAKATFTIVIPAKRSSSARDPKYVSPDTKSVSFKVVSMAAPRVVALNPGDTNCPSNGSGGYTCTATFEAPVGTGQSLTINTYASSDGSGTPLSTNTMSIDVSSSGSNAITVTLNGVAATLSLALSPNSVNTGGSANITATWNALDAAGDTIVGPGSIVDSQNQPLTVDLSTDASSGITIGAASGNTFPVTYDGNAISSPTFTAKATGAKNVTDGTAVLTIVSSGTPTPSPTPTDTPTASPSPTASPAGNAIANGDFASGALTPWYVCYAAHDTLSGPVNPSPAPVTGTGKQASGATPMPAGTPRPEATAYPGVGGLGTQDDSATIQTTTPTSDMNGFSDVALVGHSDYPYNLKGSVGICQDVTVPSGNPSLSFWIYEGGNDNFANADNEADVFPSGSFVSNAGVMQSSTTGTQLYAEDNCFNNLSDSSVAVAITSTRANACGTHTAPTGQGGVWYQRTFDLTSYANQNVTLFLGIWRNAASGSPSTSTYYNYVYFGDVTLR